MKRFLGVLLAMVMLAVPTMAEELDLSAMSNDELITLSNQAISELKNRVVSNADGIAEGMYVVGRDIKSGMYEFTCTSIREDANEYHTPSIFVYQDETSIGYMYEPIQEATCLKVGDTIGINLIDGRVLYVVCCSGQLVTSEHSWTVK